MTRIFRVVLAVLVMVLSLYGMPFAQDDGGGDEGGDVGGDVSDSADAMDMSDAGDASDAGDRAGAEDTDSETVETTESYEEYSGGTVTGTGTVVTTTGTAYVRDGVPAVVETVVVGAAVGAGVGAAVGSAAAGGNKGEAVKSVKGVSDRANSASADIKKEGSKRPLLPIRKTPPAKTAAQTKADAGTKNKY